ncbi:MAG: AAA family ATPase [Candidatus Nealsonbacteria bacterium]|nr:AAA family ATPase [Candidatus Nealsonbacteria bacterium]
MENFVDVSAIPIRDPRWIWEPYVPQGEITILEGEKATNKSSLVAHIVAALSTGRPMPGCTDRRPKRAALLLVGEDSEATAASRLAAAGADLDLVTIYAKYGAIPKDLDNIRRFLEEKKAGAYPVRLLAIDTIECFFGPSTNANQKVRREALGPLQELARELELAVILVRHFGKARGRTLNRGLGSYGIVGAARSVLQMFLSPKDPDNLRVCALASSNLVAPQPSQLFELGVAPVDGMDAPVLRLEHAGISRFSADELNGMGKRKATKLDATTESLKRILSGGRQEYNSLLGQIRDELEVSKRTIDEAKRSLGIVSTREGNNREGEQQTYWELLDGSDKVEPGGN